MSLDPNSLGLTDLVLELRRFRDAYPPLKRIEVEVALGPNEMLTVAVTRETLSIANSMGGSVVFPEERA